MSADPTTWIEPEWLDLTQQAWRCKRCGRLEHVEHESEPLWSLEDKLAICNLHFDGHEWQKVVLHVEVVE